MAVCLYILDQADQVKQTSECKALIKAWALVSVIMGEGFSPTWHCSSRRPTLNEHCYTVIIWEIRLSVLCVAELFHPIISLVVPHLYTNTCAHHSQYQASRIYAEIL